MEEPASDIWMQLKEGRVGGDWYYPVQHTIQRRDLLQWKQIFELHKKEKFFDQLGYRLVLKKDYGPWSYYYSYIANHIAPIRNYHSSYFIISRNMAAQTVEWLGYWLDAGGTGV
jgi:hypothetical protein